MDERSVEIAGQYVAQLMAEYQDTTLAYIMSLTKGHEANAWDLVQETFTALYLHLCDHPEMTIERPQHYINKIAKRRYLNSIRGKRNQSTESLEALGVTGRDEDTSPITFPARSEDEPENAVELDEKNRAIRRSLQRHIETMFLDQNIKRDMQLHLLDGYSFHEIAYAHKVPVGTVQYHVKRALGSLGIQLGSPKDLEESCE